MQQDLRVKKPQVFLVYADNQNQYFTSVFHSFVKKKCSTIDRKGHYLHLIRRYKIEHEMHNRRS
jgi:hypothetical protein